MIKVAVTEYQKFKKAVTKIPILSLKDVPYEVFKAQFNRLGVMTARLTDEELHTKDAKRLIKNCSDPTEMLFQYIEMIMQFFFICMPVNV